MNQFYKATLVFLAVLFVMLFVGMYTYIIADPLEFLKEQYTSISFAIAVWFFIIVVNKDYNLNEKERRWKYEGKS